MSTKSKKKLFKMTVKRKIILSDIIVAVNIKLGSVDEKGLRRLLVLENDKMTEERRKEKLMKIDNEFQELSLIHDVLTVVAVHEDDFLLKLHMKEGRGWRNEWDVPLDVFNESIDKMIEILRWFQRFKIEHMDVEQLDKYNKEVEFLVELKAFRNQGEQ